MMMARERIDRLFWTVATSVAICALWVLLTHPAFAQASGGTGNFSCSGGRASGALYDSGSACPVTLSFDHVFSFLVCNMEHLSSDLMGNMYCGMVTALAPAVAGVVTLAVMFFGIGFTTGVIPATAREFQKFLIKMAFVIAFATQAEYMIGIAYRFLVEGAREGIAISLSGLYSNSSNATGADVYAQLDKFLGVAMQFATGYVGGKWDGTSNPCKNAIFAAIGIMAIAFPPLFYCALLIIARIAITFFRAIFGYIYAVVAIAFLMTLSPFFLSFYMFQQTRPFFDKWVGYLVSFALQMVLVFAFLTFIISMKVDNIATGLADIVVPVQETQETTSFRFPWQYCTLCKFDVVNKDTKAIMTDQQSAEFISKGTLQCKKNADGGTANYTPIKILDATAPEAGDAPDKQVMSTLLKFTFTGLISLLILAYIVDGILGIIPQLAQKLAGGAGATYAPQLAGGPTAGGGSGAGIPGEGFLSSFGRGFRYGYNNTEGNSLSRSATGVVNGMKMMVGGVTEIDPRANAAQQEQDPGLAGTFKRFLINPHGSTQE